MCVSRILEGTRSLEGLEGVEGIDCIERLEHLERLERIELRSWAVGYFFRFLSFKKKRNTKTRLVKDIPYSSD